MMRKVACDKCGKVKEFGEVIEFRVTYQLKLPNLYRTHPEHRQGLIDICKDCFNLDEFDKKFRQGEQDKERGELILNMITEMINEQVEEQLSYRQD